MHERLRLKARLVYLRRVTIWTALLQPNDQSCPNSWLAGGGIPDLLNPYNARLLDSRIGWSKRGVFSRRCRTEVCWLWKDLCDERERRPSVNSRGTFPEQRHLISRIA